MIGIIDYGLGNITSILNMCKRLGIDAKITNNHHELSECDRLILPGVGNYKKGMENLRDLNLHTLLHNLVIINKKPILGICLGAQLMTLRSEEGNIDGLQWINAETVLFNNHGLVNFKIPHMGWCTITIKDNSPIWHHLNNDPRFYHVHSYHFNMFDPKEISATSFYGYEFVSAFRKENIYGTQFHPEKSHKYGMKVLENFNSII